MCGRRSDFVTSIQLYPDQCVNGIYYAWGLQNSNGAWYNVIHLPGDDKALVKALRAKLRRDHDVVSMSTLSIKTLLEFNWI